MVWSRFHNGPQNGYLWAMARANQGRFHIAHCVAILSLGSRPRQGVAKLRAKGTPEVMPHVPGSARECEGIDPHAPKGTPTLGVGVSVYSRIFRTRLQGSKPIALRSSLYH